MLLLGVVALIPVALKKMEKHAMQQPNDRAAGLMRVGSGGERPDNARDTTKTLHG